MSTFFCFGRHCFEEQLLLDETAKEFMLFSKTFVQSTTQNCEKAVYCETTADIMKMPVIIEFWIWRILNQPSKTTGCCTPSRKRLAVAPKKTAKHTLGLPQKRRYFATVHPPAAPVAVIALTAYLGESHWSTIILCISFAA